MNKSLALTRTKVRVDLLDGGFARKLDSLVKTEQKLVDDVSDLTERMIHFASSLSYLEEEAKRLDKANKTKVHLEEIEKHMSQRSLGFSASLRSRWNTIAREAPTLLKYHTSLPPTRDALYETARAISTGEDVSSWVRKKQVNSLSTVKDITSLRSKGIQPKIKKKVSVKALSTAPKPIPFDKPIRLEVSTKDLGIDNKESIFHNNLMLLVLRREVDPDTSKSVLVAVGAIEDPSKIFTSEDYY